MGRVQAWLAPFTWELVTAQNAVLAGVATDVEERAFREFCATLDAGV